jgi:hypothetical protein
MTPRSAIDPEMARNPLEEQVPADEEGDDEQRLAWPYPDGSAGAYL